ncbi:hypothetical protein SESBI_06521 [Sesbania bispinosa]|nr:hypothetical protein SESBI_06521 [Sesbania bispinosa]
MGYSSSGSLDHHQMQPYPCYATSGLASTPNLSTISAPETERSSLEGSVRTSSSGEGDHPLASVRSDAASFSYPLASSSAASPPTAAANLFRYLSDPAPILRCSTSSSSLKDAGVDMCPEFEAIGWVSFSAR